MSSVTKNQRVLLVVNYLATPDSKHKWLYTYLENAGPRIARRNLKDHYREIIDLRGRAVTREVFLSELESLTKDSNVRAVDLFLQLHGLPGSMVFGCGSVRAQVLGNEIKARVQPGRLRLVYSTNCYGDSHSGALLNAGFMASVGSIGVNANAGIEYPKFCKIWGSGVSIEQVVRRIRDPIRTRIQDSVAASMGFNNVDSTKLIQGDERVTIDTAPHIRETQVKLTDIVRVHKKLNRSRFRQVINNRSMEQGCIVRAVKLVRVNNKDEIIDGPSREITIGNLRRAGVSIEQDAVGTDSLRVGVVSWNALATLDLRYRVVYTVDQADGANCRL